MFKSLSPALAAQWVKAQSLKNHIVHTQQKSETADGDGQIRTAPPVFPKNGSLHPRRPAQTHTFPMEWE